MWFSLFLSLYCLCVKPTITAKMKAITPAITATRTLTATIRDVWFEEGAPKGVSIMPTLSETGVQEIAGT